ncbi:MAG: universal stress protein [Polyangia bacterium]
MSFQKILVAVDGQPLAERAVETAAELARLARAQVAFVHAVDPALSYAPESGISSGEILEREKTEGKRLLSRLCQQAALPSPPRDFLEVGKPADEIVRIAKEWAADLIVIGSHGRSGIARVLLGSVAEAVTRHAPCPVLVVRTRE